VWAGPAHNRGHRPIRKDFRRGSRQRQTGPRTGAAEIDRPGIGSGRPRVDPEERLDLLLQHLGTRRSGLRAREAARRLEQHGPNEITRRERRSHLRELARQFTHPLAVLRWAAAALAVVGGIRQVVEAPANANVAVYQPTEPDDSGRPIKVRLTTEPGAPVYGQINPDESHPYRQTEVVQEVNKRLPRRRREINAYDVQAVRAVHRIDPANAPDFAHKPRFASQQYSDAFVDWLIERIKRDRNFLTRARDGYYELSSGSS
jgi:hypothetical protein